MMKKLSPLMKKSIKHISQAGGVIVLHRGEDAGGITVPGIYVTPENIDTPLPDAVFVHTMHVRTLCDLSTKRFEDAQDAWVRRPKMPDRYFLFTTVRGLFNRQLLAVEGFSTVKMRHPIGSFYPKQLRLTQLGITSI